MKTLYFSESKTIDVHCRGSKMFSNLLRLVIFGIMRGKCKIFSVVKVIFLLFSDITCETYRGKKIEK